MDKMHDAARQMMAEAEALRERIRTSALGAMGVLTSEPDPLLDAITAHANDITRFGSAALVFVEGDRAFVKACNASQFCGDHDRQTSFCNTSVESRMTHVVPDARIDPLWVNNPYVTDGTVTFYAGYPIHYEGVGLGALCIFDGSPRDLDEDTNDLLTSLTEVIRQLLISRMP